MESKKNLYPVRENLKGKTRFEGLRFTQAEAGGVIEENVVYKFK